MYVCIHVYQQVVRIRQIENFELVLESLCGQYLLPLAY